MEREGPAEFTSGESQIGRSIASRILELVGLFYLVLLHKIEQVFSAGLLPRYLTIGSGFSRLLPHLLSVDCAADQKPAFVGDEQWGCLRKTSDSTSV